MRERAALARADELVHGQGDAVALAEPEPADARGEPLRRNAVAGELDPAAQRIGADTSMRTSSLRRRSSGSPVRQIQRKGPTPRARIGRTYSATKPGIAIASARPCAAACARRPFPYSKTTAPRSLKPSSASTCAVSESKTALLEGRVLGVGRARLLGREAAGHVAAQRVVRGGLVGDDVELDSVGEEARDDVGRVADERDRRGPLRVEVGGKRFVVARDEVDPPVGVAAAPRARDRPRR